jgi:glycosyltransferase involved in cell wall biosynthesis
MSFHANVTAALHFVRRIFPLIRAARPDARLCIVGSDPPRAIRALGSDPAISVTGYVPDLREALGRATVAVCPVTVKVGIQNKVLEAMAMGVPVVSTREGVEGLETEPGRDLLVADSPAGFAEHVCRLLADPGLRARLGSAGRRYVEAQHRWDVAASRLEDLYSEAISSRRHARSHERSVENC